LEETTGSTGIAVTGRAVLLEFTFKNLSWAYALPCCCRTVMD